MRVLALDTALDACSAAVLDTEQGTILASDSQIMVRGHAEALMPLVAAIMSQAALDFGEIDRFVVTTGPGSFTGLRVGIAAARGFGLAASKPVIGITTLAALAAPYIAADETVPIAAAIDARHQHVYLQLFGAGGRTLIPPRVTPLREAAHAAAAASARLVGSAAGMMTQEWPAGEQPPQVVDERRAPDIDWVARLGAAADKEQSAPKPFYLRPPDVHPQSAAQLPRR